jgi:hypothetical protein
VAGTLLDMDMNMDLEMWRELFWTWT